MSDSEFEGLEKSAIWLALSETPGIGLSVIDAAGNLVYVNEASLEWFVGNPNADYQGKTLGDFHPPEFVKERMEMITKVIQEDRPLSIDHIYRGRRIISTLWPVLDEDQPYDRVVVVSLLHRQDAEAFVQSEQIETFSTEFIDLGPLNVLSRRELEVLALLGHGLSVPATAKILHRSPKTVERHKTAISKKLQLRGQAELIAIASSVGLELSDANLKRFQMKDEPESERE